MADAFLSESERRELTKKVYKHWVDNADSRSLIPSAEIGEQMRQELMMDNITNYKRNEKFFLEVIMRYSRECLLKFISELEHDDKDTHRILADEMKKCLKPLPQPVPKSSIMDRDEMDTAERVAPSFGRKKSEKVACYPTLDKAKKCGTGIVFIVANFTGSGENDLPGYKQDVKVLKKFFGESLSYDVHTEVGGHSLENISKADLQVALGEMRDVVESKQKYDRFYLFVLSHGDENGVLGQCNSSLPVEDIVANFQHDEMPSMKGFPKLFFIQACRGKGYVRSAKPSDRSPTARKMPVEADVMICNSVTPHNQSFVKFCGSIFVQKVVDAFKKYKDSTEDIGTVMREVKYNVATFSGNFVAREGEGYKIVGEIGQIGELKGSDGKVVERGPVSEDGNKEKVITIPVRQVSTITDNLTMKLLFKNK